MEAEGGAWKGGNSPTKALGIPGWSKVEKRKVEEKHFEISLPRMPVGESGNLTRRNAGPPSSSLWVRDTLGWGGFSSPDEGSPLDGGVAGSNSSVEDLAHYIPSIVFPDPVAKLTNGKLEVMDDSYRHEAVPSTPGMYMYSLRGKLYISFLLHWRGQNLLLRRLSLTDRWEYKKM
jgi:hypothetical protein